MKKIIWKIEPLGLPLVLRHCKKCGKTSEFSCSGQFRVNAQRKYLDIWLIYKCAKCDTTWNAAVYSRVSPQALNANLLEGDIPASGEVSEVEIQSEYPFPVKVSTLVRDKLCLSQKDYLERVTEGKIRSSAGQDLRKCRLKNGMVLIFQ